MRKILSLTIVGICLAGCTKATTIHGPDGQEARLIECNGAMRTISSCFRVANKLCPTGYTLLGSSEREGGQTTTANMYGLYSASPTYRHIIVRCNSD